MLVFSVKGDIREVEAHLSGLGKRQVPFATALALTRTAKFAQGKIAEEIKRSFDRPKPYTLNATKVIPATKQRLIAEVKIKDEAVKSTPPVKWLAAEIYGGRRRLKAFEMLLVRQGVMPPGMVAVPTRAAPQDQYGNIEPSEINRMLSDLQARRDPLQNTTRDSRRRRVRATKRAAYFYFSTWPRNSRTAHLAPGIYRRTQATGMVGPVRVGIRPILLFVSSARYKQRLRFFETADAISRMRWPIEFALAMRQALRTAR